ncbi:conjugal transfer protein, partial [Actinocorallia aurantiaca]
MDLPTYTNVWRIEKRLYKLYDLRLPMPLPLVTIGVYAGSFLPWIALLQFLGVPFGAPWHVLYLVPPGVVAWLATRPVIEGKRLNELLQSQTRYLSEPRTWCRLTPIREPREVVVVARVWRSPRQFTPSLDALTEVPAQARQQVPAAPVPIPATAAAPPPLSEYAAEYAAAHQGAVARMQAQMDVQHVPGPEPAERMPLPVALDSPSEPLRTESVPPGAVPLDEPVPAEGVPAEPVRAEVEPEGDPAPAGPPRPEAPKRALISGIRRPGEELQYWRPADSEEGAAGTPTHAVRTTFDAAAIRQAAAEARAEEAARARRPAPRPQTSVRAGETAPVERSPRAPETSREAAWNENVVRAQETARLE